MANQWFKFWGGEYLGDPKMDAFDGNERSCWLTILSLASQSEDGWILYTSEEKLLEKSGIKTTERPIYSGVLLKFEKFMMIETRNGDVTQGFKPINWEKRQYSEGYSRVKKFRNKTGNENETSKITTEENRIDKNRIDKNTSKTSFAIKEINPIIELFKSVNPSYKTFFPNKTERAALERLIKEHGLEKVSELIQVLEKTNTMEFAPKIFSPLQLEKKLGALIAFVATQKNKKNDVLIL